MVTRIEIREQAAEDDAQRPFHQRPGAKLGRDAARRQHETREASAERRQPANAAGGPGSQRPGSSKASPGTAHASATKWP